MLFLSLNHLIIDSGCYSHWYQVIKTGCQSGQLAFQDCYIHHSGWKPATTWAWAMERGEKGTITKVIYRNVNTGFNGRGGPPPQISQKKV